MALNDSWQPSKASRIAGAATLATRLAESAVLPSPVTLSAYATGRPRGGPARSALGPAPLPRLRRVLPQLRGAPLPRLRRVLPQLRGAPLPRLRRVLPQLRGGELSGCA